jgi:CheY-like chemotaxis protein
MNAQSAAPVLVVDDDEDIRETLRVLLEDAQYPVAEAASSAQALDYLRAASSPHVVLLDFLMPGENAGTLLRALQHDATLRRHRYILIPASPVTTFSKEDQRLIAKLCTEVVQKPFEVDNLLRAVDDAAAQLRGSALRRLARRIRVITRPRR